MVDARIWKRPFSLFAVAAFVLAVVPNRPALAIYPERGLRIVVPFAPGGGTDVVARTLAQEMAKDLRVSVIIENRPGAGTIVGTDCCAKACDPIRSGKTKSQRLMNSSRLLFVGADTN